eukprot:TRINITY_DN17049_c0_g1_i1.p1 TRINITY_DN17049_c0_g1~~TRINITY_DN17049_c0_g1_i1.p1  ORF type:complete len:193 (-),score=28.12 TRINITY_DN17049_c0_g1_i1:478-987(-)
MSSLLIVCCMLVLRVAAQEANCTERIPKMDDALMLMSIVQSKRQRDAVTVHGDRNVRRPPAASHWPPAHHDPRDYAPKGFAPTDFAPKGFAPKGFDRDSRDHDPIAHDVQDSEDHDTRDHDPGRNHSEEPDVEAEDYGIDIEEDDYYDPHFEWENHRELPVTDPDEEEK